MRYKLVGIACVALFIGGGIANARIDFDDLMETIDFSDDLPPASDDGGDLTEELPAPVPNKAEPPSLLQPDLSKPNNQSPSDNSLEELDSLIPDSTLLDEMPEVTQDDFPRNNLIEEDSLRAIPELPRTNLAPAYDYSQIEDLDSLELPPAQPQEPVPYAPVTPGTESVDLDSLVQAYKPPADMANCSLSVLDDCESAPHQQAFQQCGHCTRVAPPCLQSPILPPPADYNSMYRTPACYRGLWAGYAEQKQLECSHHHSHLHGTCDCARKSQCNCSQCLTH